MEGEGVAYSFRGDKFVLEEVWKEIESRVYRSCTVYKPCLHYTSYLDQDPLSIIRI